MEKTKLHHSGRPEQGVELKERHRNDVLQRQGSGQPQRLLGIVHILFLNFFLVLYNVYEI